jgi:hypothetical protein
VLSPSCMAAKRVVVAAVVALAALPPAPARTAPEITIRAHTQITFDGIRRTYGGELVGTGQLRDKLTGDPIPDQRVAVVIAGETFTAFTDRDGRFTVNLPPLVGPQDVHAHFDGGAALDRSEIDVNGVDVDKQPLDLALATAPISGGVQVTLKATSNGKDVAVSATLSVGAADADPTTLPALPDKLASGGSLNLTRAKAGGAGRRRVRAVVAPDAVYAGASADATFDLKTATTTTFKLSSSTVAYEDRVWGSGKVADEDGKGVAKTAVSLGTGDDTQIGGRHLETTTTRADGTFSFSLEAKILGQGAHNLTVTSDPPSSAWSTSNANAVVTIKAPQPVPVAFTAAAFAATALVAGGFFLARSRPWDRKKKQAPPAERPAATDDKGDLKGGLVQAKPGLVSTLRRASDLGVSGTVRDAVRGRTITGATVRVRLSTGDTMVAEHSATTDDGGEFAFENLAAGEWKAKVSAPGHVSERFGLSIPHRGELRGVRVDLVPVREQVFALYKVAAEPLLPEARLWGVWSPRQIVDHVRGGKQTPALTELTDFVEEAYFSARTPDEDVLPTASAHVERAVRERAARRAGV